MVGICVIWLAIAIGITVHPREADKGSQTISTNVLAATDVTLSLTQCQSILYNFYLSLVVFPHTIQLAKVHFSPLTHLSRLCHDRGRSKGAIMCAWPVKEKFRDKVNNFHKQLGCLLQLCDIFSHPSL
jgi:hypothetical protein